MGGWPMGSTFEVGRIFLLNLQLRPIKSSWSPTGQVTDVLHI